MLDCVRFLSGRVWGMVCGMSSVGFNLALTGLFFREGLPLNAIIGAVGNILFSVSFLCISFQCLFSIFLRLCHH